MLWIWLIMQHLPLIVVLVLNVSDDCLYSLSLTHTHTHTHTHRCTHAYSISLTRTLFCSFITMILGSMYGVSCVKSCCTTVTEEARFVQWMAWTWSCLCMAVCGVMYLHCTHSLPSVTNRDPQKRWHTFPYACMVMCRQMRFWAWQTHTHTHTHVHVYKHTLYLDSTHIHFR